MKTVIIITTNITTIWCHYTPFRHTWRQIQNNHHHSTFYLLHAATKFPFSYHPHHHAPFHRSNNSNNNPYTLGFHLLCCTKSSSQFFPNKWPKDNFSPSSSPQATFSSSSSSCFRKWVTKNETQKEREAG